MLTTHKSGRNHSQEIKLFPTEHSVSQFGRESELISVIRTDQGNQDEQVSLPEHGGLNKTELKPEDIQNETEPQDLQPNITVSNSMSENTKLDLTQRFTPKNLTLTEPLDFYKEQGKDGDESQDLRMASPSVPRLNLAKAGLGSSQRRFKSKGSLTLSRATLSEHQRKMSIKYKQAYHEELLEKKMSYPESPNLNTSKYQSQPSQLDAHELKFDNRPSSKRHSARVNDPEQEEPKNKKSTFSEVIQSEKGEPHESRFSEKRTEKLVEEDPDEQEDAKEWQNQEKDVVPAPLLGDNLLLKNKATTSSMGQFSLAHSSDDQKSNSMKEEQVAQPELSKSEPPKGLISLFQKRKISDQTSEKSKNLQKPSEPEPKRQFSGISLGSFMQSKLQGVDGNSPFKLLEVVMNKRVVQDLIDALIVSIDDRFRLKKKYITFTKILYRGFSILFQNKQSQLQVLYWILDCKQNEFIIELGKVYKVFDKKQTGRLSIENFQSWIRLFIQETNPVTVARIFSLYEEDSDKGQKKLRKLAKKNQKVAQEEVMIGINQEWFKQGISYMKFTRILPYFMLYFLTRVLFKIKRRKALFHTVLFGDQGREERGLNSIIRQAVGASNTVESRRLQRLIMEFYKVKTQLTSNNLYALITSMKKNLQQNQFDVVQGSMLVYGDPSRPNMRHMSTWLPFNIAMQLIASELDICQDNTVYLGSYDVMQEQKFLESSVFSVVLDEQVIRPTIVRDVKQYINTVQLKEVANAKQTNSKMKALTLLRSKTKRDALAKQKIPYKQVVKMISYCYPQQLQFFSATEVEAMSFNYFYSLIYKSTRINVNECFDNIEIDALQITQNEYTQNQVKTLALTLPIFTAFLYLEEIQLKLYKGGNFQHPFYPYDYAYPEEDSDQQSQGEQNQTKVQSVDKSHSRSRFINERSSFLTSGGLENVTTLDGATKRDMSENSKTMKTRKTRHKGKKGKVHNVMKSYIFLSKYFDEYQTKLIKEFNRKKKEKAKVQEVKHQAGLDTSRLQVRTPTHHQVGKLKTDQQGKVLIRPEKFLHEKVENLQGAMLQAWNDERLKDQLKIKKLEAASKQLVFKWTRKGEYNIAQEIKNQNNMNSSITFGPKPKAPEKKRVDCSCAIF